MLVWMGYKTLSFPWIFPISVKFFFIISPASLFVCRWWSMLGLDQVKYTSLWCMSINIIVVDGIFSLKKSKSCLFFKTGSWSHLSLVHFLSLSTGILSFFAVQAGAKKVYAIEASSMASHAEVCTVSGYQTCCCFKFIC